MRKKIYLPRSADELKRLNHQKQAELWARYNNNSPYERQFRALRYYIACENANLKIERKHLTKLENMPKTLTNVWLRFIKPNTICILALKSSKPIAVDSIRLPSPKRMILSMKDSIIKLYQPSPKRFAA